ncbi:MAG: hypothetical protein ACRD4B_07600, partial [Acidobacteriota bacterium]
HNTDVTVTPECSDSLSGILECSTATVLSGEGANQLVTGTATDNSGNSAAATATVNIDKTAPTLGTATWNGNPKSTTSSASLSIPISDNLSGIKEAEYFLGDTDPGQGNGATMTLDGDNLTTTFGTDFPTGVWKVSVRAKDKAGNWSTVVSDYLVVFDSSGVRMTGKKTLLPSIINGGILPGLISAGQADVAKFGFNVRYDNNGEIHSHSDFQFEYKTGTKCKKSDQAQNCHCFSLNATSIAWLTTQGTEDSTGIFQGTAMLSVDGANSEVVFRLTGVDGEKLDPTRSDYLTLMVYVADGNPNTSLPIYRVDGDVERGNIRIRTD